MTVTPQRLVWVDLAKTFAIILVVFGHVWRGLSEAELIENYIFDPLDKSIYYFHMPLFFIISGFLYSKSYNKSWNILLRRQLIYIVWPYVLWSVVLILIRMLMSSFVNNETSFQDLFKIIYEPIALFWFLYVLFIFQIFVKIVFEKLPSLMFLLFISSVSLIAWSIIDLEYILLLNFFAQFIIFFVVGFVFGKRSFFQGDKVNKIYMLMALILFCFVEAASLLGGVELNSLLSSFIGMILSLNVIVICLYFGQVHIFKSVVFLYVSISTLAIYVSHVIFTAGIRIMLVKLGVMEISVHVILGVVFGMLFPLIAYMVTKRMKISVLVGLGPAAK